MDIKTVLRQFNFKDSETVVYLTLLQYGSSTGYEAAKLSGVPRSKIYNVLEDLFRKGAVEKTTNSEKNILYKAVDVYQLRDKLMTDTNNALDFFVKEAAQYEKTIDTEEIWILQDSVSIMLRIVDLIKSANHEILLQMWQPQLTTEIEQALLDKENDGKRVLLILYDNEENYQTKVKNVYKHGYEKEKIEENGDLWLTIVADNKELLHVSIVNDIHMQAFSTSNRSLVYFAREYILHDAYCLKLIRLVHRCDPTFDMSKIRDVF